MTLKYNKFFFFNIEISFTKYRNQLRMKRFFFAVEGRKEINNWLSSSNKIVIKYFYYWRWDWSRFYIHKHLFLFFVVFSNFKLWKKIINRWWLTRYINRNFFLHTNYISLLIKFFLGKRKQSRKEKGHVFLISFLFYIFCLEKMPCLSEHWWEKKPTALRINLIKTKINEVSSKQRREERIHILCVFRVT